MNILITSIGQRGYLVDHFKESANGKYGIYAADATKYAPALQNADKSFILPKVDNPKYFAELLTICEKNNIKAIVSINDLELPILAKYSKELNKNGILAIISSEDVIDTCFDKYKSYQFCIKNDIPVPRTYLWSDGDNIIQDIKDNKISFPLLAKPRKGSRSVGIYLINNLSELRDSIDKVKSDLIPEDEKHMFQEYIDSEQYSIHVFNNEKLKPIKVVGMVNIFKHFGETFHIRTIKDENLISLGINIGDRLQHFGPLSADVHQRKNGEFVVLEFNPRFSGCYSLSHFAGADFPSKIFDLIEGNESNNSRIDEYQSNLVMLKQFVTNYYTENEIDNKIK